jgi:hypothetical protein
MAHPMDRVFSKIDQTFGGQTNAPRYQGRFYRWLNAFQTGHPVLGVLTNSLFLATWLAVFFLAITGADLLFQTLLIWAALMVVFSVLFGMYYSWRRRCGTL